MKPKTKKITIKAKPAAAGRAGSQKLSVEDVLTFAQLAPADVELIFRRTAELKTLQKQGRPHPLLRGKTLAAIFEKSSTRTRVSFDVAMVQLGGTMLYLSGRDLQLGRGETVADTAQVLSRYVDGIIVRTDDHRKVVDMARFADVPVINALTDYSHPCQVLSDLFTLKERFGRLAGLRVAYVGDANNVARSWVFGAAKTGIRLAIASPQEYSLDEQTIRLSEEARRLGGGEIYLFNDPARAAAGADAIYTDVWTSMGQEKEHAIRSRVFRPFQVNADLMSHASANAVFMHCLPAHRGEEVTAEVIDGPRSIIFDQAENRLHVQKAILALLLGEQK